MLVCDLSSVAREAAEQEGLRRIPPQWMAFHGGTTADMMATYRGHFIAGFTECASRLPSEEEMAEAIARAMPGWNDDTSEPELEGARPKAMEAHWERVNAECVRQGREHARAVLALISESLTPCPQGDSL